ncbi:MAG: hypothetical protein ABJG86_03645 [Nitratireductor sp.]|uniref:hypothetical protein n=1 Tax=Roseitalea porphyridii TaxID=1852022 RepID=UPI0032950752
MAQRATSNDINFLLIEDLFDRSAFWLLPLPQAACLGRLREIKLAHAVPAVRLLSLSVDE